MVTDPPPRRPKLLTEFLDSDRHISLRVPTDERLVSRARAIESAIQIGKPAAVSYACGDFLAAAADFYRVPRPPISVLAARPLRVREGGSMELFGDYNLQTALIRIWTRTAVRKQVTSYGTFFSTLCHEFCHHLDCRLLGFGGSPHTRGFYQRTAALYHHARGTPEKQLAWVKMSRGRWRVDWRRMRRTAPPKFFTAAG
ncbi:MAG: hypothetical protein ABSA57_03875 [Candidatus Acidiferrales bacterium]